MATRAVALGVVLAVLALLAPSAAAGPTATWQGVTDTFVCVDHSCRILSPAVDDSRVEVGTSSFSELRLTLTGVNKAPLALQYEVDGHRIMTPSKSVQTTAWVKAPADRVLEVSVLDLLSPLPATGVREGVGFTLTAEYR